MKKYITIAVLALFAVAGQAQFSHTFTSSSTFSIASPYNQDPGCFTTYATYPNVQWDNTAGGLITTNLDFVLFFPYMTLPTDYTMKITYSSTSGATVFINTIDPSGSVNPNHTPNITLPATAVPTTITVNALSNAIVGNQRLYLYINGASNIVTIHSVEVPNATYSPGPGCTVTNGGGTACTDTDTDGVCDDVDDYPNDGSKAYSSMVATTSYMYEDLYPAYGDYDFNDLVVSADREAITDADNTLRYLVVNAEVKAAGGAIAQGWALELNGISPSDVVSVNGSNTESSVMSLGSNGTENAQTNAVIPVFDNVNNVINRAGGAFFNTIAANPTGTGETVQVTIEFAKSSNLTLADLDYNFFSFRTNERGHEIHEAGMAPTSLANQALFGTMADATDLNNDKSYVSGEGLPWAISSTGSDYAVEKTDMVEAFLKFAGWAQSGGTMYQDWHTNNAEGTYRNSAKVY